MPLIAKRDETAGALSTLSFNRRTFGSKLLCRPLKHGRHRAARTAPGRPDVDEDGDIAVSYMTGKSLFVDLDGMAVEQ